MTNADKDIEDKNYSIDYCHTDSKTFDNKEYTYHMKSYELTKCTECEYFDGIKCNYKQNCEMNRLRAVVSIQEMYQWTKQQLIDKLENWLANNICNAYNFRGDDISATFMNDCIKAMKGE